MGSGCGTGTLHICMHTLGVQNSPIQLFVSIEQTFGKQFSETHENQRTARGQSPSAQISPCNHFSMSGDEPR